MRILIVEDDVDRGMALKDFMQTKSVQVFSAQDGFEALKILKTQKVDLILSDINMPYMDGYVLAKNVKHEESTKGIPIFMYSSRLIPDDNRSLVIELGADRCLNNINTAEIGEEALLAFAAL